MAIVSRLLEWWFSMSPGAYADQVLRLSADEKVVLEGDAVQVRSFLATKGHFYLTSRRLVFFPIRAPLRPDASPLLWPDVEIDLDEIQVLTIVGWFRRWRRWYPGFPRIIVITRGGTEIELVVAQHAQWRERASALRSLGLFRRSTEPDYQPDERQAVRR